MNKNKQNAQAIANSAMGQHKKTDTRAIANSAMGQHKKNDPMQKISAGVTGFFKKGGKTIPVSNKQSAQPKQAKQQKPINLYKLPDGRITDTFHYKRYDGAWVAG
jgi:hypothetical protein